MILWKNQPMTSYDDGAFTVDKGTWGYQSYGKDGEKMYSLPPKKTVCIGLVAG